MSYILDLETHTYIPLAAHHTFGRLASAVDTYVGKPYVSKLHASIEWNGSQWRVKNLGLNGSWLNGKSLQENENTTLAVDDVLHFAKLTDPGFQIIDLAPPTDMLWPLDSQVGKSIQPIYLSRYHLLPDSQTPELAVYLDEQTQTWHTETIAQGSEPQQHPLEDGDLLQIDQQSWKFIRANVYGPTEVHLHTVQKLTDMTFVFNLSLDEETTLLELQQGQNTIDLGVRSHHYLLVQLIRHHAADAARGLDEKSRGWIYTDQLADELGLDTTHLNIHIFRLRKQFSDSLPNTLNMQYLLERRGGKIRFGCNNYKIYKGAKLTTESEPLSNA
ncbi:MAG TPA: FHA domain-containing protein [Cellvibrio sp.]|nr:FHA domain-containing protein [Cellvibrio sp.]